MEPEISYQVGDDLVRGVLITAVMSEQPPARWKDMLWALARGTAEAGGESVGAFLFQAMVDRLLEEFHAGET